MSEAITTGRHARTRDPTIRAPIVGMRASPAAGRADRGSRGPDGLDGDPTPSGPWAQLRSMRAAVRSRARGPRTTRLLAGTAALPVLAGFTGALVDRDTTVAAVAWGVGVGGGAVGWLFLARYTRAFLCSPAHTLAPGELVLREEVRRRAHQITRWCAAGVLVLAVVDLASEPLTVLPLGWVLVLLGLGGTVAALPAAVATWRGLGPPEDAPVRTAPFVPHPHLVPGGEGTVPATPLPHQWPRR